MKDGQGEERRQPERRGRRHSDASGEYYFDMHDIGQTAEDRRQNKRLDDCEANGQALQERVAVLERFQVQVIGLDGTNGKIGFMREELKDMEERINGIDAKLDALANTVGEFAKQVTTLSTQLQTTMKVMSVIGGIVALAAAVVGVIVAV